MTEMKRLVFSIFLFNAVIIAVHGQNVNVSASFDSTKIFIGDQINFTVTVDQPSNQQLTFPAFRDTLCKNIEILSGPVTDTVPGKSGNIKIIQKYLITSYDSGFYQIPPVFAEIKNSNGIKRFYSDYSRLRVMRVKIAPADKTAKFFDIVGPYRAPVTLGEILPWILIAAIAGVLIWYVIRYIKNHRKLRAGEVPVINPDPAHIIALRALEHLREEKLWQKGEIKIYYTKLTEILRQYLEDRFNVYSLELTTDETLEILARTGIKKDGAYNQLKTILKGADLVKFAKYKPESYENEEHFQNSWDFVMITKMQVTDSEKGEEKMITGEDSI
jgi:hypothetical protein